MSSIVSIESDINKNRIWRSGKTYLITREVRVKKGVTLTVEDKTTVLIVNGVLPASKSSIRRAALVFDQGSVLKAKRLYVKAADAEGRPVRHADNGGLWFLGNYKNASKDGVSVSVDRKHPLSRFQGSMITTHYLGRHDDYISSKTGNKVGIGDDIDGFSVLGVGPDEWQIDEIRSYYSADDAIDLTNSHISLKRITVKHPVEDGLNISSSRLEVHKSLILDVTKTSVGDRDLFDLETDDGASYVEIHRGCKVNVKGVLGDQLTLSSLDMPDPNNNPNARYAFNGTCSKRGALVYSLSRD